MTATRIFLATEFHAGSLDATGCVEVYPAVDVQEAVRNVLYTAKLRNGNARVGVTGRVVFAGPMNYSVTEEKKRTR